MEQIQQRFQYLGMGREDMTCSMLHDLPPNEHGRQSARLLRGHEVIAIAGEVYGR